MENITSYIYMVYYFTKLECISKDWPFKTDYSVFSSPEAVLRQLKSWNCHNVLHFASYETESLFSLIVISFSVHNLAYGLDWSSNQWWKYLSCHYRCAIPKNISGMNNFILYVYFHKIIKSTKNWSSNIWLRCRAFTNYVDKMFAFFITYHR